MASSEEAGFMAGLGGAAAAAAGSMRPPPPPPPGEGDDPAGIPTAPGGPAPEGRDNADEEAAADWDMALRLLPSWFLVF